MWLPSVTVTKIILSLRATKTLYNYKHKRCSKMIKKKMWGLLTTRAECGCSNILDRLVHSPKRFVVTKTLIIIMCILNRHKNIIMPLNVNSVDMQSPSE